MFIHFLILCILSEKSASVEVKFTKNYFKIKTDSKRKGVE